MSISQFRLPYCEGIIGLPWEMAGILYRNIRIKEFAGVIPAEQFLKK